MSALPLSADMLGVGIDVCFVPKAELTTAENASRLDLRDLALA